MDEAYYSQPIALRHPIVFYEGHIPAFSFNTLVKRALGKPSIDARLEGRSGVDHAAFGRPPVVTHASLTVALTVTSAGGGFALWRELVIGFASQLGQMRL